MFRLLTRAPFSFVVLAVAGLSAAADADNGVTIPKYSHHPATTVP